MQFFRRQTVLPFEAAFASFCVYSGLAGIWNYGIIAALFSQVLGEPLSLVFNVLYIIGGLFLFFGLGLNKRRVEAVGLIIISMSLLVRSIVVLRYAGFREDVIGSYVYAGSFFVATVARFWWLRKSVYMVHADKQIDDLTSLKDLSEG